MSYSLGKFADRIGNLGRPLPDPFPIYGDPTRRYKFRYGEVSMLAGKPGSFKSITALNWLAGWAGNGLGIMYFSADSGEAIVASRMTSIITGRSAEEIDRRFSMRENLDEFSGQLDWLDRLVMFEYRQFDIDKIVKRIRGYSDIHGRSPDVIFVDNLINFVDRPDDYGDMIVLLRELDAVAREYKSHICVLHHAKFGEKKKDEDIGRAPADHEIAGKVTQIPRIAFTSGAIGTQIQVACVKSTNGPQDPFAMNPMSFRIDDSLRVIDQNRMSNVPGLNQSNLHTGTYNGQR